MTGPVTAANIAHAIEHLLRSTCVKPAWRLQIIDYVRAGYDSNGDRIDRSDELDQQIKTLECVECTLSECPETCPVRPYHDQLKRGQCAVIFTD